MPELSGSLSNFEITSLVRFLCGLSKSGDLLLARDHWIGQLSVDSGHLTAASTDDELGRPALEFIAAVMAGGEFEFSEGPPTLAPNLDLDSDPLLALERLTAHGPRLRAGRLLAPTVVPRVVESTAADDSEVTLERVAIHVLRDVNGVRTVRELGGRHGLMRTLNALGRLQELDLVAFDSAPPPPRDHERGSPREYERAARRPAVQAPPAFTLHQADSGVTTGLRQRILAWGSRISAQRSRAVAVELTQAVLVTGLFVLGLRSVIQNFRVEGISMLPTFEGGQALVINRAAYLHVEHSPLATVVPTTKQGSISYVFGGPQRGDVVVFRAPPQPDTDYIKRIIGLPGDSVLVKAGQVFIDGRALEESYIDIPASYDFPQDGRPVIVPDGNYFVLGDNRPESFDSHLGWFVPVDNLIGRAWLRYWPPSELGVVQAGEMVQASAASAGRADSAN